MTEAHPGPRRWWLGPVLAAPCVETVLEADQYVGQQVLVCKLRSIRHPDRGGRQHAGSVVRGRDAKPAGHVNVSDTRSQLFAWLCS